MRRITALLLVLFPVLAFGQLPTYTLIDLGPTSDPNSTNWAGYQCDAPRAQVDATTGATVCNRWTSTSITSQAGVSLWVGYLPGTATTPTQAVENATYCCAQPNPDQGLHILPVPAFGTNRGGIAASLAPGGQYIVGYALTNDLSINGFGDVYHAVEWINRVPDTLFALAGDDPRLDAQAWAVNTSGEVVGSSYMWLNAGGYADRATIWLNGSPHELQYMLSPRVSVILEVAGLIDCQGNIGAYGYGSSSSDPHAYLLVRQGTARTSCAAN